MASPSGDKPDKAKRAPTALERAVRYLSRRLVPAQKLRHYLLRKGHGPDEVEQAIERLVSERLLDEPALALGRTRELMDRKGYWGWALRVRLRKDGFDEASRNQALEAAGRGEGPEALARASLVRQYGENWRQVPVRRVAGFLQRRGYPGDLIAKLVRENWQYGPGG